MLIVRVDTHTNDFENAEPAHAGRIWPLAKRILPSMQISSQKNWGLNRFDSLEQWHVGLFPRMQLSIGLCRIKALACDNVLNDRGQRETRLLLQGI